MEEDFCLIGWIRRTSLPLALMHLGKLGALVLPISFLKSSLMELRKPVKISEVPLESSREYCHDILGVGQLLLEVGIVALVSLDRIHFVIVPR